LFSALQYGATVGPTPRTRRAFLRSGVAAGAALSGLGAAGSWEQALARARAVKRPKHVTLHDIEHVVILMQENRSFDHYFGTLRGVRGYGDPHVLRNAGRPVWDQIDPDLTDNPSGHVLPFRLNTQSTSGQCVLDQSHAWAAQQGSWDGGKMDHFVAAHRIGDGNGVASGGLCMGYYERADIPFHYALADAFTICDEYHCAVFGPTNPNRIVSMSGTVDAQATRGGPCLDNSQVNGQLHWTSYPERLERDGISWRIYQESDNDGNNMLPFFAGVNSAPKNSRLARRANTIIPTPKGAPFGPALAAKLRHDVRHGRLPQVSWILASTDNCEHPEATPGAGANFISMVLHALTAKRSVWEKTVLFLTYDENDGFFDHVPPPTAPASQRDEYIPQSTATENFNATLGFSGPVGLGFRVPMLVISPFSRGGMVCSDVFDHSSLLRFLEARFGVAEPNISTWRRGAVGDLTSTLGCLDRPSYSFPKLPDGAALASAAAAQCKNLPAPTIPAVQKLPVQEPGTRPRVGTACFAPHH
jgi:phospholipase C